MWPTEGRMETNRTAILRPTLTAAIAHFRHGSRMCRERALYASALRPNIEGLMNYESTLISLNSEEHTLNLQGLKFY
jgi:hypothetical protein